MATGPLLIQQLQQDLQNELTISNQLLCQISHEIRQINQLIKSGGEFDVNIKKNESLMASLARMQQLDLENLPPLTRLRMDVSNDVNQNVSINGQNEMESTGMDESQRQ